MRGTYDLTAMEQSKLKPYFKGFISILETTDLYDDIDLTLLDLSPNQVDQMLTILGYSRADRNENGWEQDTWYYYSKPDTRGLCMFYSGFYGTLTLSLWETETEEE